MTYVSLMNKQGWQQCRGILGKLGRLNGKKIADEAGKSKVGMEQNSTCCSCPWRSIAVKGRNVDETLFIKQQQQQQQQNNSKRGRKKQTRASQQNDALLMRGYTVVSLSSMSYSSHYPGQLRQGKRKRQSQSKKKKDEMKGGVERKKKEECRSALFSRFSRVTQHSTRILRIECQLGKSTDTKREKTNSYDMCHQREAGGA